MEESKIFVRVCESSAQGFDLTVVLPLGEEKKFESAFLDRLEAEELAERINRLGVSPLHVLDIIEDALP